MLLNVKRSHSLQNEQVLIGRSWIAQLSVVVERSASAAVKAKLATGPIQY